MYAVIKTGGKQYRVSSGETLKIELIPGDVGSALVLELQPTVVVDGGGTTAEGGSDEPPRIVAVWSDEGMVTERDGRYELGDYAGRLQIAVGLPGDGAVTLKARVAVGEAA